MKPVRKVTICAIFCALGTVFLTVGALLEVTDLVAATLSSLLMVFVYLEIGAPYTYLTWICTSLLAFIFFPASPVWLEYLLIFGIYPVLKGFVERLPRWFWWIAKLLLFNAMFWVMFLGVQYLLGLPFFEREERWLRVCTCLLANVAFAAYDLFLTVMVRFYYARLRDRVKKFLK